MINGTVIGKNEQVGGITGYLAKSTSIIECTNNGSITGFKCTGGIAGEARPSSTIILCNNSGEIKGESSTGGITGDFACDDNEETNSKIEKCYNSGKITGVDLVGGITGCLFGTNGRGIVTKSYNKGKITQIESNSLTVGEIIGNERNKTGKNTLNKLFYLKNERELTAVGRKDDDKEVNKITWVTDDLNYEQFKIWIEEQ